VQVIQSAAGDRFDDIELRMVAYLAEITCDVDTALGELLAARGLELVPADIIRSPQCLVGSPGEIVDRLIELRETLGFSYISVYDTVFETSPPSWPHSQDDDRHRRASNPVAAFIRRDR
jgi:hypothetical protein